MEAFSQTLDAGTVNGPQWWFDKNTAAKWINPRTTKLHPLRFSWTSQMLVGIFHCVSAYSYSPQSVMEWRWDFRNNSPTCYRITSLKVKVDWMIFSENVINLVTIESKGVFDDAEVTAADGNIALCTIRCEINPKSKWRTWYRKHLNLTLQMEYLWNFNGIRMFCIKQHSGTNDSTGRRQGGWKIKDGGLKPEVDMNYVYLSLYTWWQ